MQTPRYMVVIAYAAMIVAFLGFVYAMLHALHWI